MLSLLGPIRSGRTSRQRARHVPVDTQRLGKFTGGNISRLRGRRYWPVSALSAFVPHRLRPKLRCTALEVSRLTAPVEKPAAVLRFAPGIDHGLNHGLAAARASSDASNDIRLARWLIALLVLFALVYLLPLGVRPLSSPDEVRYGEIAREMIASGDWVSPHFNGVRYFEKPILGHWLNSVSVAALGESRFAVRLPVALATGLSGLIVFLLARRFFARSTAVLSSAIFLTTLIFAGCGRSPARCIPRHA